MKWKMIVPVLIVALLVLTFAGCIDPIESSGTKATGGGWIPSAGGGGKATFGFTVKVTAVEPIDEGEYVFKSKGQIQWIDHGTGDKFHASVWGTYVYGSGAGSCVFAGKTRDGLTVAIWAKSSKYVKISVSDEYGNEVYSNSGVAQGNINVN